MGVPFRLQWEPCSAKNVFRPVQAPKKMELPCSLFFIEMMRLVRADRPSRMKPGRGMERTRKNPPTTERILGSCTNMDSPKNMKAKTGKIKVRFISSKR